MFRPSFAVIVSLLLLPCAKDAKAEDLHQAVDRAAASSHVCTTCQGDGYDIWLPYSAWSIKPGTSRVLGDGELFVPLWEQQDGIIFADVRGQVDDSENYESNWGLGMRHYVADCWIVGAYSFFDRRRTENDNSFNQVMFGLEALSIEWEARVNAYIPQSDSKAVASLNNAQLIGNNIFVSAGQERALGGFDIEVGKLLYAWGPNADFEVRGFLGAYHFDSDGAGVQNVSGPRGRVEARVYDLDWLGEGSRVTLAGELQWDHVRDTQAFAGLRVRIPLYGWHRQRKMSRLERRMVSPIVRDVDIVSSANQGDPEVALDPSTGLPYEPVTIVTALDNIENGGTGPAPIVADAPSDSLVLFLGHLGVIKTDETIQLQFGQRVFGSGALIPAFGAKTGVGALFAVPGGEAIVTETVATPMEEEFEAEAIGAIPIFAMNTNAELNHLTIVEGQHGVLVADSDNFLIKDNTIRDTHDTSILVLGSSPTGMIMGNHVTNSENDALGIFPAAFAGEISWNTFSHNDNNGVNIAGDSINADIIHNTVTHNGDGGIFSQPNNFVGDIAYNDTSWNGIDGVQLKVTNYNGNIVHNTSNHNDNTGFLIQPVNRVGDIAYNTANHNGIDGMQVLGNTANGALMHNTANWNTNNGIIYQPTTHTGEVSYNTTNDNGIDGLQILGASFTGNIDHNTANNNGNNGMFLIPAGLQNVRFNTANGNGLNGMFVAGPVLDGDFLGNTANNNGTPALGGTGMFVIPSTITGDVAGNTANGNNDGGLTLFGQRIDGNVAGNTTNFNGESGMNLEVSSVLGVVKDNTFNFNGRHGFFRQGVDLNGFENNTAKYNAENGFLIQTGSVGGFDGNYAMGNGDRGLLLNTGSVDGDFTGNYYGFNGLDGAGLFTGDVTGDFTGNYFLANGGDGFILRSGQFTGDFVGNLSTYNGGNGFTVQPNGFTGDFALNIAALNSAYGIFYEDLAGAFTGNFTLNLATENDVLDDDGGVGISGTSAGGVGGGTVSGNLSFGNGDLTPADQYEGFPMP